MIEKDDDFSVDIEFVPVNYRVHIRTSANNSSRIEINESDFSLTVDELLKKANIPWTGTKKGQLSFENSKKPISTNDSLQRLGIKPPPSSYNLSFKIPSKTTTTVNIPATTPSRPIKPHKTGNFEQLKLDVRVFLDDGDVVLVNLRGQSREFKGDVEFAVKSADFNRIIIDELLSRLGKRWPTLEPEGWLQSVEKTIAFNGRDKLTALGIIPHPDHTNSYNLVFPLSDEQIQKLPTDTVKTAVKNPPSSTTSVNPQGTTPSRGITEGFLGVNVRMFYDDPYYNIQFTGVAGDIRVESDLSLKKNEYENLTFGELKRKLRRWPETNSAGKLHSQKGNIAFSDSDKLYVLGMTAPSDGKPVIHQFSWELK